MCIIVVIQTYAWSHYTMIKVKLHDVASDILYQKHTVIVNAKQEENN